MALTGFGQGFFNTANQTALIASVPRDYRGLATGMVQMVFGLGALLGMRPARCGWRSRSSRSRPR